MICNKCNALIPDDIVFCPECGAWAEPAQTAPDEADGQIACPSCENGGAKTESVRTAPGVIYEQIVCPFCGAALTVGEMFCENCGAEVAAVRPQVDKKPKADKKPKVGNFFETLSNKTKIPVKFLKMGMVGVALIVVAVIAIAIIIAGIKPNYVLYSKNGTLMYAKMPYGKPVELTDGGASEYWMSKDGKKLFYLQDKNLYYVDVTEKDPQPQKLASDITTYGIAEDGSRAFFIIDGDLYQCDLRGKSEKIQSNVTSYRISSNGKTLIYTVSKENNGAGNKYDLYRAATTGKNLSPTKIHSGEKFGSRYFSKDGKAVIFTADDNLYIQTGSKSARKIAANASLVGEVYDNSNFYYYVSKNVTDTAGNVTASGTLYYYNGRKSIQVAEKYERKVAVAEDAPVLAYYTQEEKQTDEGLKRERTYYIAVKGKASEIKLDDIGHISLRPDGKEVLIVADCTDGIIDKTGTLYKESIGSKIGSLKKVDVPDVSRTSYTPDGKNVIYATKYISSDIAIEGFSYDRFTLYVNGKRIAEKVSGVVYSEESDMLIYYKADHQDMNVTLWSVSGGKSRKIDEKVTKFQFTPDGTLLYVAYGEDGTSALYRSTGGAGKLVDTDVRSICYVNTFTD